MYLVFIWHVYIKVDLFNPVVLPAALWAARHRRGLKQSQWPRLWVKTLCIIYKCIICKHVHHFPLEILSVPDRFSVLVWFPSTGANTSVQTLLWLVVRLELLTVPYTLCPISVSLPCSPLSPCPFLPTLTLVYLLKWHWAYVYIIYSKPN